MKSTKAEVRDILEGLPENASLEDIQYHLYVRQKIEHGLRAAREGRTMPHAEAVRRVARWIEK